MGFARLEHAGASAPLFSLPFPACGEEGFGKGNFVALSSSAGVRETGEWLIFTKHYFVNRLK